MFAQRFALLVSASLRLFDRKPAQEKPWTKKLWIYDLRTNQHFTLKENPLKREHLDDFVSCYFGRAGSPLPAADGASRTKRPTNRHERQETERFKAFDYADLIKRDKINLDMLTHASHAFGTASLRFAQSVSHAPSDSALAQR